MSHLSPLYIFSLSASGEEGTHWTSIASEIKTWWRVSEQCVCYGVCCKQRIKPPPWGGLFRCQGGAGEEKLECWQGSLTLAWYGHTNTIRTTQTHKGSRFVLCIIYETLPLSLVLHLGSTQCQEKSHMHVYTPCRHVSACSLTIFIKIKKIAPRVFSKAFSF